MTGTRPYRSSLVPWTSCPSKFYLYSRRNSSPPFQDPTSVKSKIYYLHCQDRDLPHLVERLHNLVPEAAVPIPALALPPRQVRLHELKRHLIPSRRLPRLPPSLALNSSMMHNPCRILVMRWKWMTLLRRRKLYNPFMNLHLPRKHLHHRLL